VAYQADIVIAVKGAAQLTNLQKQIQATSASVDAVNKKLASQGLFANSLNNLQKVSTQANQAMRNAATGTTAQKQAIDLYVRSLAAAEKAEVQLTTAIKNRQRELGIATKTTAQAGSKGLGGKIGGAVSSGIIGGAFPLLFGQGGGAAAGGAIGGVLGGLAGPGGGFAGSLLGTLLGDIATKGARVKELANDIGFSADQTRELEAAFAQAGQEADKFEAAVQNIRGLGLTLDDQADSIKLVTALTSTYGGQIDKVANAFTSALESGKVTQGTLNQLTSQGIPIQDALAEKYGVSRSALLKMTKDGTVSVQALTDALITMGNEAVKAGEKPKTAFEQFNAALSGTATAVGNVANVIATALAPAIDAIINKATLALNALTEVINTELLRTKIQSQTGKIISPQRLQAIEKEAMTMAATRYPSQARGNQLAAGAGIISPRAQQEFQIIREQLIRNELKSFGYAQGLLSVPKNVPPTGAIGAITAPSQAAPSGNTGAKGPKPPEDRTAQLLEDLKAMERISKAQDDMRNALFEGNKLEAINLEYKQKVADIERDTAKLLLNANYATEKDVYLKQQAVRLADAQAVRLDEIRELERDITEEYYSRAGLDPRNLMQNQGAGAFDLTLDLDPNSRVVQGFDEMRKRLEELQDPINMATKGAESIGSAFSEAFTSIATGTQSAQQALANFFKGVGTAFVDMASQIIAQMLTMYAFKQLLGIFGGTSTGLFTGAGPVSGASVFGAGQANFNPAAFDPGLTFSPGARFAKGGFVTGPTRALIGEGGEPEYVIPASKMRGAMSRYSAGARGSGVIPSGSGDGATMGATMTAAPIDVRYTVERINSVDYVTADQFQAGLRQAASQGAERGQQLALRRLQQSPSARRRVGI